MDYPDIEDTIDNLLSEELEEDHEAINRLARLMYGEMGYHVKKGFDFEKSRHPQEKSIYNQAAIAVCFCREHFKVG